MGRMGQTQINDGQQDVNNWLSDFSDWSAMSQRHLRQPASTQDNPQETRRRFVSQPSRVAAMVRRICE